MTSDKEAVRAGFRGAFVQPKILNGPRILRSGRLKKDEFENDFCRRILMKENFVERALLDRKKG